MNRKIKKVAVLGSGIMGSRLACHFANIGLKVVLLDIVTPGLDDDQLNMPIARNKLVNESLKKAVKSNPSPLYLPEYADRIKTGNFEDNLDWISDCDWVLEAVIENLPIKQELFAKVEECRKPGTIITSNTSGIPIELMIQGRSEDFQKHFAGTHFFNPPRYLRLLEIIPSSKTDKDLVDFLMNYGDLFLGKKTVLCNDAPAFIANRIGVFSIMAIFHLMEEMGLTVEEVDALTGPISGRPKSATFRTCDLVGIDTLVKVADGVRKNCPDDEAADSFEIPAYVSRLVENNWVGDKSGQGFYKKTKNKEGNTEILALDLAKFEYQPKAKPRLELIANLKQLEKTNERLVAIEKADQKEALFLQKLSHQIFSYVSNRIPEISHDLFRIDDAVKAGFGWEVGPFEHWDLLGVSAMLEKMKTEGLKPASWVNEMVESGIDHFYKIDNGVKFYYDVSSKSYTEVPGRADYVMLESFRQAAPIWQNSGAILHDLGDGVLNLEFTTKMNVIGGEVLEAVNHSIEIAENGYTGLVIGNEGANFSAGANLGMMFMLAVEQEFDELDMAVRLFQNTVMRIRYSGIPVVIAPHGLTLGGSCEMTMHADAALAAAETYIGLVEVGVGIIPAGGGTKEMVIRASDSYYEGDTQLPQLQQRFINIATAKVATSGYEAFDINVLSQEKDEVVINLDRLLAESKKKVIELAEDGYTEPVQRTDIEVMGKTGLGTLYAGAEAFEIGHYASQHDLKIARKLAFVMCGGDLSSPTRVSEQYLLDLEREAFLSLVTEKKTMERIQHMLKTGKPLRN